MNKKNLLYGIILCFLLAIPSWILGKLIPLIGGPVFSIIIGIIVSKPVSKHFRFQDGIKFVSKKILQYAVILLGFGMNLHVILEVGMSSLPIIISTITISLCMAYIFHRALHIPGKTAAMIGIGSSICGGSAIAASAPVIDADESEIAQAISVIFFFNVIAAFIFPSLGSALQMTDYGFGIFAGTAINDTSSVTAAASAWDTIHHSNALETAAIVKMTRTLAIIPITLCLALLQTRKSKQNKQSFHIRKIFPFFILYFLLASIITTILTSYGISERFFLPFHTLSKFMIVMAMSAIGLQTDFFALIKKGGKPIFLGFICWISITMISLLMQCFLQIL